MSFSTLSIVLVCLFSLNTFSDAKHIEEVNEKSQIKLTQNMTSPVKSTKHPNTVDIHTHQVQQQRTLSDAFIFPLNQSAHHNKTSPHHNVLTLDLFANSTSTPISAAEEQSSLHPHFKLFLPFALTCLISLALLILLVLIMLGWIQRIHRVEEADRLIDNESRSSKRRRRVENNTNFTVHEEEDNLWMVTRL